MSTRARHAVSQKIHEAIDLIERAGESVTPGAVRINVHKTLTYADFTSHEALDSVIDRFLPSVFKSRGFVIADRDTRERKSFWESTPGELRVQLDIQRESSDFDRVQIVAREAVIKFLDAKHDELGYDPYPELFADDIARIYAMYGLATPAK